MDSEQKYYVAAGSVLLLAAVYTTWIYASRPRGDYSNALVVNPHGKPFKSIRPPPSLSGYVPFLGVAIKFGSDTIGFLNSCRAEMGDVFSIYVAGHRMYFIADPVVSYEILKSRELDFYSAISDVTKNISTIDSQRLQEIQHELTKLNTRFFLGSGLPRLQSRFFEIAVDRINNASKYGESGLKDFLFPLFFTISTKTVFGKGFRSENLYGAFRDLLLDFKFMAAGLPEFFVKKGRTAQMHIKNEFRMFLMPYVNARSSSEIGEKEIDNDVSDGNISELMKQMMELMVFEKQWDPEFFILFQLTFIHGAQVNAMNTFYWVIARILSDAELYIDVKEEINRLLTPEKQTKATFDSKEYKVIDSVLSEVVRYYGHSSALRRVLTDHNGIVVYCKSTPRGIAFHIPSGSVVYTMAGFAHRDDKMFPHPNEFNNKRYFDPTHPLSPETDEETMTTRSSTLVFGGGSSYCPGRQFMRVQVITLVVLLLRNYEIKLCDGDEKIPEMDRNDFGAGILQALSDVRVSWKKK
ncbi:hypothetical protein HK098_000765 [Nowakowskiella sp. JEL0407]|nr:hypothetical protein HK098_000765 [Nowakowskiella sp. JEL0407]